MSTSLQSFHADQRGREPACIARNAAIHLIESDEEVDGGNVVLGGGKPAVFSTCSSHSRGSGLCISITPTEKRLALWSEVRLAEPADLHMGPLRFIVDAPQRGNHPIQAVCAVATALASRLAAVLREGRTYTNCDVDGIPVDGIPVDPTTARRIIRELYTVPPDVRAARRVVNQAPKGAPLRRSQKQGPEAFSTSRSGAPRSC